MRDGKHWTIELFQKQETVNSALQLNDYYTKFVTVIPIRERVLFEKNITMVLKQWQCWKSIIGDFLFFAI